MESNKPLGIFLMGAPGSGKDYLLKNIFSRFDLTEVQIEHVLNGFAKELMEQKRSIVINGAMNQENIEEAKKLLEGYSVDFVCVSVTNNVSKLRNSLREKPISESKRFEKWKNASQLFERVNGFVFNNSLNLNSSSEMEKLFFASQIEKLLERIIQKGLVLKEKSEPKKFTPKLKKARSVHEIAAKHDIPVGVVLDAMNKGIKVEREHTNDHETAKIIASAHIWERPDYYKRLAKVEKTNEQATPEKSVNPIRSDLANSEKTERRRIYRDRRVIHHQNQHIKSAEQGQMSVREGVKDVPTKLRRVPRSGNITRVMNARRKSKEHWLDRHEREQEEREERNQALRDLSSNVREEQNINSLFEMQLVGTDAYRRHAISMTPGQSQEIEDAFPVKDPKEFVVPEYETDTDCGCGGNCRCDESNDDSVGTRTTGYVSEGKKRPVENDGIDDGVEFEPEAHPAKPGKSMRSPGSLRYAHLDGLPVVTMRLTEDEDENDDEDDDDDELDMSNASAPPGFDYKTVMGRRTLSEIRKALPRKRTIDDPPLKRGSEEALKQFTGGAWNPPESEEPESDEPIEANRRDIYSNPPTPKEKLAHFLKPVKQIKESSVPPGHIKIWNPIVGDYVLKNAADELALNEAVEYHIQNKIPFTENVFRPGSDMFFKMLNEAKRLYNEGEYTPSDEWEKDMLESNIGEIAEYEGRVVVLDYPFLEEDEKSKDDPCWDGYIQKGMKKKNGKMVPNCVSINEELVSLDEVFDSAYPHKYHGEEPGMGHIYTFQVPSKSLKKKTYQVTIEDHDEKPETAQINFHSMGLQPDNYKVIDREGYVKRGNSKLTGDSKGISARILSTVKKIAIKHAKEHGIKHMEFDADNAEASRIKLYDRIARKYGGGMENDDSWTSTFSVPVKEELGESSFKYDVDHMSGPRVPLTNTNCTTCSGRKRMYSLGGSLFADNKKGATPVICPTCKGTGDRPGAKKGLFEEELNESEEHEMIRKEFKGLKAQNLKDLRRYIQQTSKVIDVSGFATKERAITHILRSKHGDKRVDAALNLKEDSDKTDGKGIGKPWREGGGGAVYVRDGGKILKVRFSQSGMKKKYMDPAATRSFVARHRCLTNKDKTSASYWACRWPRFFSDSGQTWW
jgi:hypothetical protein